MSRTQRWYALWILALFAFLPSVVAAEVIRNFSATYEIQTDGSVLVTERIVYDFEEAVRHGIFRTLETDHPQPATSPLKERVVAIEVRSVQRDGREEPYEVRESADEFEVKIGDANRSITGIGTYELSYVLRGALSYGSAGAELYWNATGHNWPVMIETAEVEVIASRGALAAAQTCYEGSVGNTGRCTSSFVVPLERALFSSKNLAPGDGMTVAQAINPALVGQLVVEQWQWLWIMIPVIGILLIGFVIVVYRRLTAHKPNVPIIAQYEPYGDLLPMYTGVVFDGQLDHHDITAGIVYLAEQGFIKIKHVETKVLSLFKFGDYELTLLRPPEEAPNAALQLLLQMIFSAPDTPAGPLGIRISIGVPQPSAVVVGETVLLSALKANARLNAKIIYSLQVAFLGQLYAEGYVERPGAKHVISRKSSGVVAVGMVVGFVAVYIVTGSVALSLGFLLVPIFMYGLLFLQRLTRKGYEARYHLQGFKEFLSVTDKERFDFHNAPEKSPELFMKYLPYAIALKVEDKWAKAFEGITIPNPDWYDGGTVGAFSAAAFTADLSTFSSSFSASSGTSGSSGGGSSGGGGGGGGGGSW